jgi:RNA polymerase sigma factor for flagellar operon FliA
MMPLDRYERLVDAIKALPHRQQMVMSLRYEHNLNDKEIARATGWSEDEVRILFEQALATISPDLIS